MSEIDSQETIVANAKLQGIKEGETKNDNKETDTVDQESETIKVSTPTLEAKEAELANELSQEVSEFVEADKNLDARDGKVYFTYMIDGTKCTDSFVIAKNPSMSSNVGTDTDSAAKSQIAAMTCKQWMKTCVELRKNQIEAKSEKEEISTVKTEVTDTLRTEEEYEKEGNAILMNALKTKDFSEVMEYIDNINPQEWKKYSNNLGEYQKALQVIDEMKSLDYPDAQKYAMLIESKVSDQDISKQDVKDILKFLESMIKNMSDVEYKEVMRCMSGESSKSTPVNNETIDTSSLQEKLTK